MTTQKFKSWTPVIELKRYFTPTIYTSGECAKARYKNYNLPILQLMYNGNEKEPLKCLISKQEGWKDVPCFVDGTPKQRFNIDFNHIRQRQNGKRQAGISVDKIKGPSDIFRGKYLDKVYAHPYDKNRSVLYLLEFMSIMPISQEYHSYISQDSAIGHLTLQNFAKETWPWVLQSKENYNEFFEKFKIDSKSIPYNWMIDHLSDIKHDNIHNRINCTTYQSVS